MKRNVKITYEKNYPLTKIDIDGSPFEPAAIHNQPIEHWAFPFVYDGQKWGGIYKELVTASGTDAPDINFDGDEASFAVLQHALTDTPIQPHNIRSEVVIVYTEEPFTTKVIANGDVLDASLIQNRAIEEWVGSIQARERYWLGIFKEIANHLGSDSYTIYFMGDMDAYRVLMKHCPTSVNLYFRDAKLVELTAAPTPAPATAAAPPRDNVNTPNHTDAAASTGQSFAQIPIGGASAYCRHCGAPMAENAGVCIRCGVQRGKGTAFCPNCGQPTTDNQAFCLHCGVKLTGGSDFLGGGSGGDSDFVRVAEGKLIAGVCTGLGRKWNTSPWIVRAGFVFLPIWPIWLIIYIVMATKYPLV